MSLAFRIRNLDDVIKAFAAKEEFISALTLVRHGKEYTMTPTDEYYVAPYCFMSTVNRARTSQLGFLIFSSMAPFGKTFPTFEIPKMNEPGGYPGEHDTALELMKTHGHHNTKNFLFLGTVEWFQEESKCKERDIYTFTPDGYYPSLLHDVSQHLEDMAFHVICDLMKWKYPVNWRRKRAEQLYTFCSILDLADYDNEQCRLEVEEEKRMTKLMKLKQQRQLSKTTEYQNHYPRNDNKNVSHAKEEEEKKESANAFDTLRYQSSSPSYYDERGGGFLERTPEYNYDDYYGGGGNTFISDYNTVYDEDFQGI